MAFQQFTFPQVLAELELSVSDEDFFGELPREAVSAEFEARIKEGADLASAIYTEKARSEFVIAPVLLELRRRHRGVVSLFSGVELVADAATIWILWDRVICKLILLAQFLFHSNTSQVIPILVVHLPKLLWKNWAKNNPMVW